MSEAEADATSAAEASAWLNNPTREERRASMAQQLAEEPEWDGPDYEGEECEPCAIHDQPPQ